MHKAKLQIGFGSWLHSRLVNPTEGPQKHQTQSKTATFLNNHQRAEMSLNQSRTKNPHNVPDDILNGIFSDKDKIVETPYPLCGCSCKSEVEHQESSKETTESSSADCKTRGRGKYT